MGFSVFEVRNIVQGAAVIQSTDVLNAAACIPAVGVDTLITDLYLYNYDTIDHVVILLPVVPAGSAGPVVSVLVPAGAGVSSVSAVNAVPTALTSQFGGFMMKSGMRLDMTVKVAMVNPNNVWALWTGGTF